MQHRGHLLRNAIIGALVVGFAPSIGAGVVTEPGFAFPEPANGFVGQWNGSSAVAIAPNWIVTAAHTNFRSNANFRMDGVVYTPITHHIHPTMDVMVIQVNGTFPGYHDISDTIPDPGQEVILGGYGLGRGTDIGDGYIWDLPREERWATNTITFNGASLLMQFDAPGSANHTLYEGAFANNDSGGGVFTDRGDALVLEGIATSVTGVFGQSNYGTYSVALSLAPLRDWIYSTIGFVEPISSSIPPPFPGGLPTPGTLVTFAFGAGLMARRRRR